MTRFIFNPFTGNLDAGGTAGGGGGGNVTGAASSTDNAVVRFDGVTGKIIQNSLATLSDTGLIDITTSTATTGAGLNVVNLASGVGAAAAVVLTTLNGQSYVSCASVASGSTNAFCLGVATISGIDAIELCTGQAPATGTRLMLITPRTFSFMNRGMRYRRVEVGASYVVLENDYYIGVTSTAAPRTITLPSTFIDSMGTSLQQTFVIKDQSGGAATNNITVTVNGGAILIDGSTTAVINTNYGSITVVWNGTQYYIV